MESENMTEMAREGKEREKEQGGVRESEERKRGRVRDGER